jgi:hypothetical protein
MKNIVFAFAVMMFMVGAVSAQVVNNDDEAIRSFIEADSTYMSKADKHAIFTDDKVVYAGNSSTPTRVETRRIDGLYLTAGVGVNVQNKMTAPQVQAGVGYAWNWGFIEGSLAIFKAKPYKASDDQRSFTGSSFEGTVGVKVFGSKHDRFYLTATAGYNRTKDFQDLGSYESKSVEETSTQIITTTESGEMSYGVNLSSVQFLGGVEYNHAFYNSPIHIGAFAKKFARSLS